MTTQETSRILPIKGGFNFRDLGGIPTKDGKTIKRNLLFRTDELSNLQPIDLELLAQLNIQTVVDFRTDFERSQSIDKVPTTCKNQIHLDILAANMESFMTEIQKGISDFKPLLMNFYKEMVLSDDAIKEYSAFFKVLENHENSSIIYHCTAGKDRTGVATALILEALNVNWNEIESDYMLSNVFLKTKYQTYISQNPALADVFLVQPTYLKNAFEAINETYQSVENYLKAVLKVDLELMKNIYLE
ncbi:tyrosine-protein phosphatase [Flavobacterium sp. I3-2]|uniref:tyrosine-protein phosphatase n=1 Tax=Flavobacterium sp. I3-2 TaxID=2748319 RepID=UPI0015AF210E|nr:tyrosine-protein phosphatase [Flavobacterium sp. I3-2]